MANELGSFSRRIRAFAQDVPAVANEIKKRYAKEVLTNVVPATPVDTGQARSNWNVGISTPDFSTIPTKGKSGDNAIQRGVRKINTVRDGNVIHISNGLPYIARLNNGWSKQAPVGFIEKAFQTALLAVRRIRYDAHRKAAKR